LIAEYFSRLIGTNPGHAAQAALQASRDFFMGLISLQSEHKNHFSKTAILWHSVPAALRPDDGTASG